MSQAKRTYHGSCHCGAVRYEAKLDLAEGTFRCNCSICAKARSWLATVKPEDFRLLAGEESLADYQFGAHRIHHHFCKRCGVRTFGWADIPGQGKFYAIQVASLDHVDEAHLARAPVKYVDGRHDRFDAEPAEKRHL